MQQQRRWFRDAKSFGIYSDSGDVIARNLYRDVETADGTKQRVFPGVFVRPEYRGAGLAAELTKHSIDISISEGFRIVPTCSYIASWVREHDGGTYQQYRDEPGTEHFYAD